MAHGNEISLVGTRLARFRKQQKLSAEAVSELIPDGTISRAIITNIENGRKSDPSVSELVKIASALGISPLALLLDLEDPWAPVPLNGLAGRYNDMTTIEYGKQATVFDTRGPQTSGFDREHARLLSNLVQAETEIEKATLIQEELRLRDAENSSTSDESWTHTTNNGEEIHLTTRDITEEQLATTWQNIITAYRTCLGSIDFIERIEQKPLQLPQAIRQRLGAINDYFSDVIAAQRPDLDYGQHDGRDPDLMLTPALTLKKQKLTTNRT